MSDLLIARDDLLLFSVAELRSIVHNRLQLPGCCHTKDAIVSHILKYGSDEVMRSFRNGLDQKLGTDLNRKIPQSQTESEPPAETGDPSVWTDERDPSRYLDMPDEERLRQCYEEFYNHTGNEAVQVVVCAICA
jgi:hypothetical protein